MSIEQATNLVNEKFRVIFGFDGEEIVDSNGTGEFRRAVGWGGEESTFTWKRFVTLEDNFNPSPGELNPWSLKRWYLWGARKFHFHNPFGRVARGKSQELVYEVDQFLNARDGLTINGELQNTPMPWLVNDFVSVIKALTTGQRGTLDQATWNSWTVGNDAWFNPAEPIDLIVYIGSLADPFIFDPAYNVYIDRWEERFRQSTSDASNRLKDSVSPLIEANCRIAFDSASVAPGPIAGQQIPFDRQSEETQQGWWSFWIWLDSVIGRDRLYIEAHPFRTNGINNPYLGWNVISDDDFSSSYCCLARPFPSDGPHMTSEMGTAEFIRAFFQTSPRRTPLISRTDTFGITYDERYSFLTDSETATDISSDYEPVVDRRLSPPSCCNQGHNYYWHDLMSSIIAYHLMEKQNIRGETNPENNLTRNGILVSNTLLQVLPQSYPGDIRYSYQFGIKYPTKADFVNYISRLIEEKRINETGDAENRQTKVPKKNPYLRAPLEKTSLSEILMNTQQVRQQTQQISLKNLYRPYRTDL